MFAEKKTPQISEINVIGKNTSIIGDIISEGDFRIDGTVEGNVKTNGKVVIGVSGNVNGTINCKLPD